MNRLLKIWIALAILLAAAGVGVGFFTYRSAVDATAPARPLEALLMETDGRHWADAIRSQTRLNVTEFENEADVIEALLCQPLVRAQISVTPTDDPMLYILTADGREFCRVTLGNSEKLAAFGLPYKEIRSTEILDSWMALTPRTVTVTGPIDMHIRLNGLPVSTDLAAKTDDPDTVIFTVAGIYTDYTLEIRDGDNNVLPHTSNGDDHTVTEE